MRAHVLHAESIRRIESCCPAPTVTMIAVVRRALVDHEAVPGHCSRDGRRWDDDGTAVVMGEDGMMRASQS